MKKNISEFVGGRIKSIRKNRGLTQKELGLKLGVKHNTISSYEKGTNEPEQNTLFRLADILDCSINDFFPYNEKLELKLIGVNEYIHLPTAISAGLPFEVDGVTDYETMTIPDELMGKYAGHKDIIISKINGDSMDKLMNDGSFIAIKQINNAEALNNGDIVVFSHNHEYSVKYFYKHDDMLIFKPYSNNPVHYDQSFSVHDGVVIHGKVVTYIVNLD